MHLAKEMWGFLFFQEKLFVAEISTKQENQATAGHFYHTRACCVLFIKFHIAGSRFSFISLNLILIPLYIVSAFYARIYSCQNLLCHEKRKRKSIFT